MTKQELEALVLAAVDRVLAGKKVEDSLIECKGDWPDPVKVRQLAAHANRARGEEIVWIIGLDEKTAQLTSPKSVDLADWWSRMGSRFDDHVIPDMWDLKVPVNEKAVVTALVFSTDRAPYVVKVSDAEGRVEREIPIRDGTRTRSAYRHEIIRLLHTATPLPSVSLIQSKLSATISPRSQRLGIYFTLNSQLYVEQGISETVMIPHHLVKCRLLFTKNDRDKYGDEIKLNPSSRMSSNDGTNLGVHSSRDGIRIAGAAVLDMRSTASFEGEPYLSYINIKSIEVETVLGVAGATRPILVKELLELDRPPMRSGPLNQIIASWSLMNQNY